MDEKKSNSTYENYAQKKTEVCISVSIRNRYTRIRNVGVDDSNDQDVEHVYTYELNRGQYEMMRNSVAELDWYVALSNSRPMFGYDAVQLEE